MRKSIKGILFLISYVPLYSILFFQNIDDTLYNNDKTFISLSAIAYNNRLALSFLFLIIISITLYFVLYKVVLKSSTEQINVVEIEDNNTDHLSYLATYILPFVGLKFDCWQNTIATIALFYVLGHIYVKTNLILTNPTLTFFGFNISKIIDENNLPKLIIHKTKIIKGKGTNFIHLSNNIYIQK